MPIPVINYSAQQPQGNPMFQDVLATIAEGYKLGQMPRNIKLEQQQAELANALNQNKLNFAPQMSEQELLQAQLSNQYYPEDIKSQINLRNTQAQMMPENLEYKRTEQERLSNRFNAMSTLNQHFRGLKGHEQARFIADNPELYAEMQKNIFESALREGQQNKANAQSVQGMPTQGQVPLSQRTGEGIPRNIPLSGGNVEGLREGLGQQGVPDELPLALSQINAMREARGEMPIEQDVFMSDLATALVESGSEQNIDIDDIPSPKSSGRPEEDFNKYLDKITSPESIARLKRGAQISASNALATNTLRKQVEGAKQARSIFNNSDFWESAQKASEYAGAAGKAKGFAAKLFQQNPEGYMEYLSFKNQKILLLENRIRSLDSMSSTDTSMRELKGMFQNTMELLSSNPKQFMIQLHMMDETLAQMEDAVEESYNVLGYERMLEEPTQRNRGQIEVAPGAISPQSYENSLQQTPNGAQSSTAKPRYIVDLNADTATLVGGGK